MEFTIGTTQKTPNRSARISVRILGLHVPSRTGVGAVLATATTSARATRGSCVDVTWYAIGDASFLDAGISIEVQIVDRNCAVVAGEVRAINCPVGKLLINIGVG